MNEVGGVNLDDYVLYKKNYDAVTYIHKSKLKYLEEKKKKVTKKVDDKKGINNDYVAEQTIKFAEHIAPIVIPPSDSQRPAYYSVKSCNKCKRRNKKSQTEDVDITLNRKATQKVVEVYRNKNKIDKQSTSRDSFSSTSNTLDDINNNQSLSTISEQDFKVKKDKKRKYNKVTVSESFEAVAELTEYDDKKIKIHLMNEKEKQNLTDSIRIPVINALKDCLEEINNIETREELKVIEKYVSCNTQTLNNILTRLEIIEKHLLLASAGNTPRIKAKASTLEQLGEDLNVRNISFEDDNVQVLYSTKNDGLGAGEITEDRPTASVGVKTDKNRLPARFCWTDANRNQ